MDATHPLHVLLVDDDLDTVTSASALINLLGHNVCATTSAEAALESAPVLCPDVMLIDLAMPKLDGFELAKRLRKSPQFARTRLVAVSGYVDAEHRRMAIAAGFDEFLAKPYWLADLERIFGHVEKQLAAAKGKDLVARANGGREVANCSR